MEPAEKLSVTVTPAMARMIREKVAEGSYGSASEVMRAALRALQRDDEEHAQTLASIKARIKASVDDPRPAVPVEEAFGRIKNRLAESARENDDPASGRRSQ